MKKVIITFLFIISHIAMGSTDVQELFKSINKDLNNFDRSWKLISEKVDYSNIFLYEKDLEGLLSKNLEDKRLEKVLLLLSKHYVNFVPSSNLVSTVESLSVKTLANRYFKALLMQDFKDQTVDLTKVKEDYLTSLVFRQKIGSAEVYGQKVNLSKEFLNSVEKVIPEFLIGDDRDGVKIYFLEEQEFKNFMWLYHRDFLENDGLYLWKKKNIFINSSQSKNKLLRLVIHEYVHHLMVTNLMKKGVEIDKLPLWYMEGMAEYYALSLIPELISEHEQVLCLSERRLSFSSPYKEGGGDEEQ